MNEREVDNLLKNQAKFCERICKALDNRGFSCDGCEEDCCHNQIIGCPIGNGMTNHLLR